ncbi:MAG: sulfotransferase, partial [Planctomycetaceae bacterium]
PAFEAFYREHLRKIVWLRGGGRYLSKGNYNFTRLGYLARLFPEARFLVPVRDPVEHVDSLVRQHRQFCEYAKADARVAEYLKIAGHFEFGPQRQPLRLDTESPQRTRAAWEAGEEHRGYAVQWRAAYQFLQDQLAQQPELRARVLFVRHEDFCESPRTLMRQILEFTELPTTGLGTQTFDHIRPSPFIRAKLPAKIVREIAHETSRTARDCGYECD